jgi:hypothetical protein
MADEKAVLITIDINANAALDDLKKTQAALEEQKKILNELISAENQNTDAIATQTAVVKNLQTEIKARERIAVKAANSESDSYNSLSAQYSLNTIALNKMSIATRSETDSGKQLESETEQIRLKMIALKEATQDHTLKVGRYADANISLKTELRQLNNELIKLKLSGDENSDSFKTLVNRLGDIKRAMGDAKDEAKFAGSEFKGLDKAVGTLDAVSSAASVAVGATALLGGNAEDMEKAFAKLAVIEQTLNAVQRVANALEKESAFMKTVSSAKTWLLATAQGVYTAVVGTSTGALKAFKLALAGTGIGLVVIGIGYLISNWEKLTGSVKDNTDAINENTKDSLLTIEDKVKNIDKLNKRQLEDLKSSLEKEKQTFEDAQLEKTILAEKYNYNLGKSVEQKRAEAFGKEDYFAKSSIEIQKEANQKKITDINNTLKKIEQLTKEGEKKKAEVQTKIQIESEQDRLNLLAQMNKIALDAKEKVDKEANVRSKILDVENDNDVLNSRLNRINAMIEAEQGHIQTTYDLKVAQLETEKQLVIANYIGTEDEKQAIREQYDNYERALAVQKFDSLASLGEQAFKTLGLAAGKNAKIQKFAAQGENAMATYLGITRALGGPGGPTNPVNIAGAVLMGITGIANGIKISNTPLQGGNPTGPALPAATQQTTTAAVGQGIVTRDTLANQSIKAVDSRPTLVVDDVTFKQTQQNKTVAMGTI